MATFIHSRPRSTDITAMPSTWLKLTIHSATMHHERCSREIDGKAIAIDPGYLTTVCLQPILKVINHCAAYDRDRR